MKEYADRCSHAKSTNVSVGGKVLVRQPKQDKVSIPFQPEPLEITGKKETMITAQNTKRNVIINASFFKKLPSSVPVQLSPSDEEDQLAPGAERNEAVESVVGHHQEDEAVEGDSDSPPVLRISARTRRAPKHLKDIVSKHDTLFVEFHYLSYSYLFSWDSVLFCFLLLIAKFKTCKNCYRENYRHSITFNTLL